MFFSYPFCIISWLQALIERTNLNPAEVGDIVVGTVLAPGSLRAIECRMAAFYAGFPGIFSPDTKSDVILFYISCCWINVSFQVSLNLVTTCAAFFFDLRTLGCFSPILKLYFYTDSVPLRTVNRQCSSGLQAVADVAAFIKAGYYDIGNNESLNLMVKTHYLTLGHSSYRHCCWIGVHVGRQCRQVQVG